MLLRQAIKQILVKTESESSGLLERLDSLSDCKLLVELEKLWSTMTVVKTGSNVLADDLGLKDGSGRVIVCLTDDQWVMAQMVRMFPDNISTQGRKFDSFYEIFSFFKSYGSLGGVIMQRPQEATLLEFSHFCSRIANYLNDKDKEVFYILAPVDMYTSFNPHFIPRGSLISSIDEIKI